MSEPAFCLVYVVNSNVSAPSSIIGATHNALTSKQS